MLATLSIKNLATVESLDIDFGRGLNAITGETGAGKSVILGAVQTVLGERAEKTLIRQGADRCEITAQFELAGSPLPLLPAIESMLEDTGVPPCEDGILLLRRIVTPSSTRCYINSAPTALRVMRELGDMLVDIHGPHDHQSLLSSSCQLSLLDTFAGDADLLTDCADAWRNVREAEERLLALQQENLSPAECEFLRHQIDEIDKANLDPEEEEELQERHRLASHSRRLIELAGGTANGLSESDGSCVDALAAPARNLREMEDITGETSADFAQRLEDIIENLHDLSQDLNHFAESMELDAEEFAMLEDRLGLIHELKRKYRGTIEEILAQADDMRERLAVADNREETVNAARKKRTNCQKKHASICQELFKKRTQQGKRLAKAISGKLSALGFASNRFRVKLSEATPGKTGKDRVEFMFAPNPGQDLMPLRKIASSGEMARVMLAIKTVLAEADPVPLLIFDEVDANVGGRIADSVAAELASVADEHQVLCITHLPQIAAAGHVHFQVGKDVRDNSTLTSMTCLTTEQRVNEIVRMMGGADSATARAHAEEMLAKSQNN